VAPARQLVDHALSWTSHLVPLVALVAAWRGSRPYWLLAVTGAFIYYATYLINLILWNDPAITINNALLLWRPCFSDVAQFDCSVGRSDRPFRAHGIASPCCADVRGCDHLGIF